MPASVETSIASVAQYLAQQERNPVLLVKAIHDYVADRIAYDAPSYFAGRYPPQDAETVFTRRTAVCAGYAKLLEALGQAIGVKIVYVVGDARTETSDLSGQSHAWNAVQLAGQWHLIDATWDSGSVNASGFKKQYRADYLMPPPEVLAISHFPKNPDWLLLPKPLSRGEFLRQPMLEPQFFSQKLKLISPTRSQTEVQQTATVQLQNPQKRWLLAAVNRRGESQSTHCADPSNSDTAISCPLPERGTYDVRVFTGQAQSGNYTHVAHLEFNRT
jgi:transglutaminase/protease-like cytokinesis protein 3